MNIRKREAPMKGDGGAKIKGAVTARKGGEGQASGIKGAVSKPCSGGYKKIRGAISG